MPRLATSTSRATTSEVLAAIGLWILQIFLSLVFTALVGLRASGVAACNSVFVCDFQLITFSQFLVPVASALAAAASIPLAVWLGRSGGRVWVAPLLATAVTLVAFLAAVALYEIAVR
jgi:hypothetical protein